MEGFEVAQLSTWPLKVDVEGKGNLCASHLKGRQSVTHCNVSFHCMITIHMSLKLGRIATCMRYAFHLVSRSHKKNRNKKDPLILPVSPTSSKRVSDFPY